MPKKTIIHNLALQNESLFRDVSGRLQLYHLAIGVVGVVPIGSTMFGQLSKCVKWKFRKAQKPWV